MKTPTGKSTKPKRVQTTAAPTMQLSKEVRLTIAEVRSHLKTSKASAYQLIKAGVLKTFTEGRRRYANGADVAALCVAMTPDQQRALAKVKREDKLRAERRRSEKLTASA